MNLFNGKKNFDIDPLYNISIYKNLSTKRNLNPN